MNGIENAQFDLIGYVQKKMQEKIYEAVEDILRKYIDNPIEGELTREKVKAAGIRSVFFRDDSPELKYESQDEKNVNFTFTTNLIGVAQGNRMILPNGARRPLTEKEEEFLAQQETYEAAHLRLYT